jgi:hypothetical protein
MPKRRDVLRGLAAVLPLAGFRHAGAVPGEKWCRREQCDVDGDCPEGWKCEGGAGVPGGYATCRPVPNPCAGRRKRPHLGCMKETGGWGCCTSDRDADPHNCVPLKRKKRNR